LDLEGQTIILGTYILIFFFVYTVGGVH